MSPSRESRVCLSRSSPGGDIGAAGVFGGVPGSAEIVKLLGRPGSIVRGAGVLPGGGRW